MTEPTLEEIQKTKKTGNCGRCGKSPLDTSGYYSEDGFACGDDDNCRFEFNRYDEGRLEERERFKKQVLAKSDVVKQNSPYKKTIWQNVAWYAALDELRAEIEKL